MSYFIIQSEETKGPYTIGQLRSMWNSGAITGDTLYCEEGYEGWLHLRVLADQLEPQHVSPPPMRAVQQPKKIGLGKVLGFGCLGMIGLFVLFAFIGAISPSSDSDGSSSGGSVSQDTQPAISTDEYEKICKGVVSFLFNARLD